ncbi:MAG: peptide/nickel transport system permease protein [Thermotogota bacterium]|nr:peptide/nickel transport system permease protein [Thermotogota bacterium]MDK2864940.1 peptide/nickel transport system permease protein [Thermotogota bacterium]HCZ07271.1 peptide ABC transporter permease [Thermotogota bacterium]
MGRLALTRVLLLIPVLLGVSIFIFLLMRMIPGDPAIIIAGENATPEMLKEIRDEFDLDEPLIIQYITFMRNLFSGKVVSIKTRRPVFEELFPRFLNTLQLTLFSMAIAVPLGMILGVLAAAYRNSFLDNFVMVLSLLGVSMPVFWLGIILILIFAVQLGLLPSGGKEGFESLVLPSITIAFALTSMIARMTRAMMIETLSTEFIRTAKAYGLPRRKVIYKYALKNVMIPIVTVIGLQFGYLLGGAVLTESVFGWPGIGRYIVDGIFARDYSVVQTGIMFLSAVFVLVNLGIDILYMFLDPKIRRGVGKS